MTFSLFVAAAVAASMGASSSPSAKASTFSGWSGQMSPVTRASRPAPVAMAWLPQGSPAQKPSMAPSASARAIMGGGTTTRRTSCSGSSPPSFIWMWKGWWMW